MSRDLEEVWSPEYDSTWEEEGEDEHRGQREHQGQREPGIRRQPNNCRKWMSRAARDLHNYRHGYGNEKSCQHYLSQPTQMPNLEFYLNKRRFEPDGLYIDNLLEEWKKKYEILERNHSYIQWLFPLREYGMNSCAKPLTEAEITEMKKNPDVQRRFVKVYNLMLDFYGIKLENKKTGKVIRAGNWEERFKNLNDHSHNNLRITRILKCLGELGFERYQAPLVEFFLKETLCECKLQNVKRSALDYFMFTVKNKTDRRKLVHFAWENYKQEKFIWGPAEKLRAYKPPAENEHETEVQKEKNDESDEESQVNGQLGNCEFSSNDEEFKDHSESIALNNRVEAKEKSHGKFPDKGSGGFPEATFVVKEALSCSSSGMNGVQFPTVVVAEKSYLEGRNPVSYEDHEVPSEVVHQEGKVEKITDGTASSYLNENLQQDNVHKKIDNILLGTPKKRKMLNVASDMEGTSDIGSLRSDDLSGIPKCGGAVDSVKDDVKKLKLSEQPITESTQEEQDNPLSTTVDRDLQQPGNHSDEEGVCSQMEIEDAKGEMPKLHEQSNSENHEKEDDPSTSSSSEDPK